MTATNRDATDPRADVIDLATLPIIDMSVANGPGSPAYVALVEEVRRAASTNGFFYLVNHGVAPELMKAVVVEAQRLFAADASLKQSIAATHSSGLGYGLMGGKALHGGFGQNVKQEFYYSRDNVPGMTEENRWPAGMPGFRETLMDYIDQMHRLAETLMSLLAQALALSPDYFDTFCADPLASVRLVSYPPIGAEAGAHTDFGALTFLLQDTIGGLQVYDRALDGWIQVEPIRGAFVVNLGDLFEVWTNKTFRSTPHRVVHPPGQERISVPFFYTGAAHYRVECLPQFLTEGAAALLPPTTPAGHLHDGHEAQGF